MVFHGFPAAEHGSFHLLPLDAFRLGTSPIHSSPWLALFGVTVSADQDEPDWRKFVPAGAGPTVDTALKIHELHRARADRSLTGGVAGWGISSPRPGGAFLLEPAFLNASGHSNMEFCRLELWPWETHAQGPFPFHTRQERSMA